MRLRHAFDISGQKPRFKIKVSVKAIIILVGAILAEL